MSKRKDIERAQAGYIFRNNYLGEKPSRVLYLRCNKCGNMITESFIEKHIISCQGGQAECGKCHTWIKAAEFLTHWKTCKGKEARNAAGKV